MGILAVYLKTSKSMVSFGIVSEGITDYVVIENILCGIYEDDDDDPVVRLMQPQLDETDKHKQGTHGGWAAVLQYCESDRFKGAFQQNDFMIIQIDTDRSFDVPFNVNHEGSVEELWENVKTRLIQAIGNKFYEQQKDKIIFAIAIHETECWLVPLYSKDKRVNTSIKNCFENLGRATGTNIQKVYSDYNRLSDKFIRLKHIDAQIGLNYSFDAFIAQLKKVKI